MTGDLPLALSAGWQKALGGKKMAIQAERCPLEKKAILVVSFGTTYADTMKLTIESTENKIRAVFPGYEVN